MEIFGMNSYLFILEHGNGYRCLCCRQTFQTSEVREFTCDAEAEVAAQKVNDAFSMNDEETDVRVRRVFALSTPTPLFDA